MKNAFSVLEIILVLVMVGILSLFALPKADSRLSRAANTLLLHIAYTRHLALNDNLIYTHLLQTHSLTKHFKSIDPMGLIAKNPMWQMQFHLSGKYTFISYSIYVDTPRFAPTTNYDGRPMSGDVIATQGGDRKCLSGYNNTNAADECKNNSSAFVRLTETYGIEGLEIDSDRFCKEGRSIRIYFDRFGLPYCGNEARQLTKPLEIILEKSQKSQSICILPSGHSFLSQRRGCEKKNSYSL